MLNYIYQLAKRSMHVVLLHVVNKTSLWVINYKLGREKENDQINVRT